MSQNFGVQKSLEQLQKAKEALGKEDAALALILADQSLEYFLKNCSIFLGATESTTIKRAGKEISFSKWGFVDLITFLDKHNFITKEEKSNFFLFHSWRNPVQHIGLEPSKKQVETVISFAEDFIESQIEARKQVKVVTPTFRKFVKAMREIDPESKIVEIDPANDRISYNKEIVQHRKIVKLTNEELIRAYLITKLATKLHYPCKAIELEKSYRIGRKEKSTSARTDIVIYKNGKPFMICEVKRPDRYEHELASSIESQLYPIAHLEDPKGTSLQYLVYYTADVTEKVGIAERFVSIEFRRYPLYESWVKDGQPNLMLIPKEYGIVRKPIFIKGGKVDLTTNVPRKDLDSIRWSLHNILYGGGKYQTELFFNLLGLFLAKIYDEKTTAEGEAYKFQIAYKDGDPETPEEVYAKVDNLYRNALKDFLGYSKEQLNKEKGIVFDAPKVKYVVDILQDISLTSNTYDVLGDFFEKIVWGEFKQSKGQYLTHPNLVNFTVRALNLEELAIKLINEEVRLPYIIDAACGSGTFLIEAMKLITRHVLDNPELVKKSQRIVGFAASKFPLERENVWANDYVYGIEINKDLAMATKVNMVMHGDGSVNIEAKDALVGFKQYLKSFLEKSHESLVYEKPVNEQFDVVISNPPFSITIDRDTAKALPENFRWGEKIAQKLEKQTKKKEVNVETLFLERWYQLLKPNGRLGVVLPESIFDTTENRYIRLFLYKYFNIKAVISLPDLAFQPYTSTKTSLLFAQKKTEKEIEEYSKLWESLEKEYEKLKRQVDTVIQKKNLSLDTYKTKQAIPNLFEKYLHSRFDTEDSTLAIPDLIEKYLKELKEVDSEWWVFHEISKKIDYPIFMAHANEIGYKRTVRGELEKPNDLFAKEKQKIIIDTDSPTKILDHMRKNVRWS